jgi:uncharacterized OB-fold protein
MSEKAAIPLPRPSQLSRPHWDGCREGVLRVQRCGRCGHRIFIPHPTCTHCHADALSWVTSSGRGTVYSYTIVHRPPRPAFEVPYVVAIVELEDGWHMLTNLVEVAPEAVHVGMPVEVHFRAMSDEVTLPYFRPRARSGG